MYSRPYRPRISRETRLLLTTALLALIALWALARLRFPERPVTPTLVPPALTQLVARQTFDDLVSEIAEVRARVESSLLVLNPSSLDISSMPGVPFQPFTGLRIRDDLVIALLSPGTDPGSAASNVVHDSASGLTAIRISGDGPASVPALWYPSRLQEPRYLMASDVSSERVSLRPVFVGALDTVESPVWRAPIWLVPAHTDVAPGTFVFSSSGELAGLAVRHDGAPAVVPAAALLEEVEALLTRKGEPVGDMGIRVQPLTPALAAAAGASSGVLVAWVDENGPATDKLNTADVIEAVNGQAVATPQFWNARLTRLAAGETVSLRVRRGGMVTEVQIVAPAVRQAPSSQSPGLTLRTLRGRGAEVIRVEPYSVADRTGLASGDVITFIAGVTAPTPAQVRAAIASAREGQPVLLGRARGETHEVIVLAR